MRTITDENKNRRRMQDKLMRTFGFEDDRVILFCKCCEWEENEWNNHLIKILFDCLMA